MIVNDSPALDLALKFTHSIQQGDAVRIAAHRRKRGYQVVRRAQAIYRGPERRTELSQYDPA
jgi:hypothetical protein